MLSSQSSPPPNPSPAIRPGFSFLSLHSVNSASPVLKSAFFVSASPFNLSKLKGSKAEAPLTPSESALTKSAPITRLESALPKTQHLRNPHLHKKMGGGGKLFNQKSGRGFLSRTTNGRRDRSSRPMRDACLACPERLPPGQRPSEQNDLSVRRFTGHGSRNTSHGPHIPWRRAPPASQRPRRPRRHFQPPFTLWFSLLLWFVSSGTTRMSG